MFSFYCIPCTYGTPNLHFCVISLPSFNLFEPTVFDLLALTMSAEPMRYKQVWD